MRIGILGAGRMADALGTQWTRAGHELMISGRDPERTAARARRIGPPTRVGTWAEAARFGDVVLLAVRDTAVPEVLSAAGADDGALRGRVLVDCVNAVHSGFVLATAGGPSMAERVARQAVGARVVKAFNHCHEDVWRMTPPAFDGTPLAVPMCGDDPDALATVATLVRDLGCTPVEAGPLDRAGLLEATTAFLIALWHSGVDARTLLPPLTHAFGPR
ncbi:NADPH-dependent F420 reductase [Allostreptomyces psammosilenae]|uniref:Pyrroline-5-carboxylate reductase catalytic N-terminal domain-containing protein n=1 Tax=Allostreptomyces psammosilenae TaxID=1892865 RepID=A0A852ZP44_9ACTN|nr:hypothetical protein [Allostreptomyces psammosilenae]